MCLHTCREKEFRFSGIQRQTECYCGNEPVDGFTLAWWDKCDRRCAGNSNQICGGSNAMTVYSTPGLYLDGLCIYDYPAPKCVLCERSKTGLNHLTLKECRNICKGLLSKININKNFDIIMSCYTQCSKSVLSNSKSIFRI